MEAQIDMLIASYGLERLLEDNDITEEALVELLVEHGLINLEDYFDE